MACRAEKQVMLDGNIEEEATYASNIARQYISVLEENKVELPGLTFLEIGPGRNVLHAFALKAAGIEVTLADRFVVAWEDFDQKVAEKFAEHWWPDAGPVVADAISVGRFPFRMLSEPAEDLRSVATNSMGAVFSHAALEHVYDMAAVSRELYRVTCPGGLHRHQIDFRDHRDFVHPLEFLLEDDQKFAQSLKETFWRFGNRLRPSEIIEIFFDAGFELSSMNPNETIGAGYLRQFLPRLRAGTLSRYATWPAGDLIVLGARFIWHRPDLTT
jgi:SAM-dependent methyltransferase